MCPLRDIKLKSRRDSQGALATTVGLEESTRSPRGILETGSAMIGCITTRVRGALGRPSQPSRSAKNRSAPAERQSRPPAFRNPRERGNPARPAFREVEANEFYRGLLLAAQPNDSGQSE